MNDYVNEDAEKAESGLIKDYRAVFSTPQGQRVLDDLKARFDGSTVISGDSLQTYGMSCAREVYLYIKYNSEDES